MRAAARRGHLAGPPRGPQEAELVENASASDELFEIDRAQLRRLAHRAEDDVAARRRAGDLGAARSLPPVGGYLVGWLTGEIVLRTRPTPPRRCSTTSARGDWSSRLVEAAGIELRDAAAGPSPSTDVAGALTPAAAELLGLTADCQVLVGTGDEHGAALAAGLLRPGSSPTSRVRPSRSRLSPNALTLDDGRLVETHAARGRRARCWSRTPASSRAAARCGSPSRVLRLAAGRSCSTSPRRRPPGSDGVLLPARADGRDGAALERRHARRLRRALDEPRRTPTSRGRCSRAAPTHCATSSTGSTRSAARQDGRTRSVWSAAARAARCGCRSRPT